jgi:hypothetical protein
MSQNPLVSHLCLKLPDIFFPHLLSSHHKSTQSCLHHYFRWHGGWDEQGEDEES